MSELVKTITRYLKDSNFSHVYHFADTHIRREYTRHSEYIEIMTEFAEKIKIRQKEERGIAVICGDIFHSKTNLTPDAIQILKDFLRSLPVPVLVIAGNHDVNMSNRERLDALSPTIDDIKNVIYLRDSGIYKVGNLWFGVYSVIDGKTPDFRVIRNEEGCKIALHHGTINGATTATGHILTHKKNRSLAEFEMWDITMLGDIHKCQALDNKGRIRYPGSFIQQDFGEMGFHGALVWHLETRQVSKINTDDVYGWYVMHAKNGKLQAYDRTEVPKKVHIKLMIENTTPGEVDTIKAHLRDRYDVISLKPENKVMPSDGKNRKFQRTLQNCKNLESSEFRKYLTSIKVPGKVIKKIMKVHEKMRKELLDNEKGDENYRFRPLRMRFTNMFVYKGDWEVTFPEGVVGLFGANGSGKSSIIDIMVFALFDKKLRGTTNHEMVTHGESNCAVLLEFESNGKTYGILKEGTVARRQSRDEQLTIRTRFWEINGGHTKDLTGNKNETCSSISSVVGTYADFQGIGAMIQGSAAFFVDQSQAARKDRLNRILNLEKFDELCEKVKPLKSTSNSKLKNYKQDLAKIDNNSGKHSELKAVKRKLKNIRTFLSEKETFRRSLGILNLQEMKQIYSAYDNNISKVRHTYQETVIEIGKLRNILETEVNVGVTRREIDTLREKYLHAIELEKRAFAKIDETGSRRAELIAMRSKYPSKSDAIIQENRLEQLIREMSYLNSEINIAENEINDLKHLEYDPNCSFCIKNTVGKAHKYQKQLPELKTRRSKLQSELKSLENAREILQKINEIDKALEALPVESAPVDVSAVNEWFKQGLAQGATALYYHLQTAEKAFEAQYNALCARNRLSELLQVTKNLEPLLNHNFEEICSLDERIDTLSREASSLENYIGRLQEQINRAEDLRNTISETEAEHIMYSIYEKALGRDGIQKVLRNEMIQYLEEQMNAIIGELAPFCIKIDGDTATISFVKDARNNNTQIFAHMGSGSEKLLIELALRTIMATRAKHSSNILILDESLSFLDAAKRDVLEGLFTAFNRYFKTVLIISHDTNVKEHVQTLLEPQHGNVDWDAIINSMPVQR